VHPETVFSRTVASWRLAFMYAGQSVHFLIRAVLLSFASLGLVFARLCCWADRVRSSRSATEWIIPIKMPDQSSESRRPIVMLERPSSRAEQEYQPQPRTIDDLIRNKEARV
jgi:hypothetical protein